MIKYLTVVARGNSVAPLLKRLCRFHSVTSVSNISLNITHFANLREVFVIWYVMNKKIPPFFKNAFPFVHNPSFKLVTQNLQKHRVVGCTVQKGRIAPKMQQNPRFFHKFFSF
jgi:hypothetical protein